MAAAEIARKRTPEAYNLKLQDHFREQLMMDPTLGGNTAAQILELCAGLLGQAEHEAVNEHTGWMQQAANMAEAKKEQVKSPAGPPETYSESPGKRGAHRPLCLPLPRQVATLHGHRALHRVSRRATGARRAKAEGGNRDKKERQLRRLQRQQ